MRTKVWPAAALAFSVLLLWPAAALAARPLGVTRGLDYFHAKQRSGGGFSQSSKSGDATITPWVMIAISAARENPARWEDSGSPITYLQKQDLERAATATATVANAPAYYSRVILAYHAAGRDDLVFAAGSKRIDLLAKVLSFRDSDGHFSPQTSGGKNLYAVETTCWALLAMKAAGETGVNISSAVTWLRDQQKDSGGFPQQPGADANVDDSARAVLALRAAGVGTGDVAITKARDWIRERQQADGGLPRFPGDRSEAQPTSWALQMLNDLGIDPGTWLKNGHSPLWFLNAVQAKNGSYLNHRGDSASPLVPTSHALVAVAGRSLPFGPPSDPYKVVYRPHFDSFTPRSGAKFRTGTVTVKAHYGDNPGGTGVHAAAVKVTVDGHSKRKAASITAAWLTLRLKNLSDGTHTVVITVSDWAGNTLQKKRTFKVNKPEPPHRPSGGGSHGGSTPTPAPTYNPNPSGGRAPTVLTPTPATTLTPGATSSATPYGTISPSPYSSSSGTVDGVPLGSPSPGASLPPGYPSPSSSASVSGQVAEDRSGSDGDNTAAYIGGAMAALVPVGVAGSFLFRKRLLGQLAGAGHGRTLPGGGSPWQHFKARLGIGKNPSGPRG